MKQSVALCTSMGHLEVAVSVSWYVSRCLLYPRSEYEKGPETRAIRESGLPRQVQFADL